MNTPLCFVLMPFGEKKDATGQTIDFNVVYRDLIAPAIREAGLQPLRADEEMTGGIIHKPMFERLILCEYAIADLTTANANVFYELGVRHATRPWSTVLLFANRSRPPIDVQPIGAGSEERMQFDVAPLRALPYSLGAKGGLADVEADKKTLVAFLKEAKKAVGAHPDGVKDSPLYQLLEDYPNIQREKTDVFRHRVAYSEDYKEKLTAARKEGVAAVERIEKELGTLANVESGTLIDLFLSYRAVKAWDRMVELVAALPAPLAATVMVQEQLALALNRKGEGEKAERVLTELIKKRGPSSETYGILGRVYKDRWEAALKAGETFQARGLLKQAVEAYLKGFEADWRDAYPGVNAVTLMELSTPPDPRREALIPVVAYAVERRIASGKPDYWDHATLLELAVLAKDEDGALDALGDALAAVREVWEPETTARNLRLIREAREERGERVAWAKEVEDELEKKASE